MTQSISRIGLFSRLQSSALSCLTRNPKMTSNHLTLAAAPNRKATKLSDMAKSIKAGQKNITNFKGTREEFIQYLKYQISSGDINIQAKPYKKTIRTSNGEVYKVSTIGVSNDTNELIKDFSGYKTARIVLQKLNKNKKFVSNYDNKFAYNTEEFKKNSASTKEYAAMKQKYGII